MIGFHGWRAAVVVLAWVLWSLRRETVDTRPPVSRWDPLNTYATRESCEGARLAAAGALHRRPPASLPEGVEGTVGIVQLEDGVQVFVKGERAAVIASRYQCFSTLFDPRR